MRSRKRPEAGKTNWRKGLQDAPQDKPILVRLAKWDCPCVMRYEIFEDVGYWGFCEVVLADIAGALEPDEVDAAEWAPMPE